MALKRSGSFLANANLFFPFSLAVSMVLGGPLMTIGFVISGGIDNGNSSGKSLVPWPGLLSLFVPLLLVLYWACTRGLAPREIDKSREERYSMGHTVVALSTLAAGGCLLGPILSAQGGSGAALLYCLTAIFPVAVGYPIGVLLIWSARARGVQASVR